MASVSTYLRIHLIDCSSLRQVVKTDTYVLVQPERYVGISDRLRRLLWSLGCRAGVATMLTTLSVACPCHFLNKLRICTELNCYRSFA